MYNVETYYLLISQSQTNLYYPDIRCVNCSLLLLEWLNSVIIHTLITILPKRRACFTNYRLTLDDLYLTSDC